MSLDRRVGKLEGGADRAADAGEVRAVLYMPVKADGSGRPPGVYREPGSPAVLVMVDLNRPGTGPGQRDYRYPG